MCKVTCFFRQMGNFAQENEGCATANCNFRYPCSLIRTDCKQNALQMKHILYAALACMPLLCGCHESLEKRAQREAREYTEKYCPTPVQNYTRTDSVVFDITTKTYHYYCSVTGMLDNKDIFEQNRAKLTEALLATINESTGFRAYKKEGFAFQWTLRSDKDKNTVYFDKRFAPEDYNKR